LSYLRLVQFTLSQTGRAHAQAMADDLVPAIKQQPGCLSAVFFGGGDDGRSGLGVVWDSQEHADAASAVISPKVMQHLAGNIVGDPDRQLFSILAS
jgi:quinol monooxygenase YgiN